MKLGMKVIGEIRKDLVRFDLQLSRATKGAMVEASNGLKNELRADIRRAFPGTRTFPNSWRGAVYPKSGDSKNAAASVWSEAPHIVSAFDKGTVIRARRGKYLAVPLPQAQKTVGIARGRFRITPELLEEWYGIKLVMVKRAGKYPLLVGRGLRLRNNGTFAQRRTLKATKRMGERTSIAGLVDIPLFVLIPYARVADKLNVEEIGRSWGAKVPSMIDKRVK